MLDMYELITDKTLKIKDKNFTKDQIKNELGGDHEEIAVFPVTSDSYSPSRATDQDTYEEDIDQFDKVPPKVTVTHMNPQESAHYHQFHETPVFSAAASETPNGSESVLSSMSVSHNVIYHEYSQEETPILPPPPPSDTPVNSFLQLADSSEADAEQTPTFQNLPRLPVRERSHSISENSFFEPNKRQRVDFV